VRQQFVLADDLIAREIRLMTDPLTDELFAAPDDAATTVRFAISRLVAAMLIVAAAALASYLPVRRATRVDAMAMLRGQ
jgi:hypothetical protein